MRGAAVRVRVGREMIERARGTLMRARRDMVKGLSWAGGV